MPRKRTYDWKIEAGTFQCDVSAEEECGTPVAHNGVTRPCRRELGHHDKHGWSITIVRKTFALTIEVRADKLGAVARKAARRGGKTSLASGAITFRAREV